MEAGGWRGAERGLPLAKDADSHQQHAERGEQLSDEHEQLVKGELRRGDRVTLLRLARLREERGGVVRNGRERLSHHGAVLLELRVTRKEIADAAGEDQRPRDDETIAGGLVQERRVGGAHRRDSPRPLARVNRASRAALTGPGRDRIRRQGGFRRRRNRAGRARARRRSPRARAPDDAGGGSGAGAGGRDEPAV